MRKMFLLILSVLVLLLWVAACERLGDTTGSDHSDSIEALTEIPAEYGELQAVTIMPEYPGWFQLWFEDPAGTIRQVRVHPAQKLIHRVVQVIPRSGQAPPQEEE